MRTILLTLMLALAAIAIQAQTPLPPELKNPAPSASEAGEAGETTGNARPAQRANQDPDRRVPGDRGDPAPAPPAPRRLGPRRAAAADDAGLPKVPGAAQGAMRGVGSNAGGGRGGSQACEGATMNDEMRKRLEAKAADDAEAADGWELAGCEAGRVARLRRQVADLRTVLAEIDRLQTERDAILNWLIVESYTSDPKWSVRLPDGLVDWYYTREQAAGAILRAAGLEPEGETDGQ